MAPATILQNKQLASLAVFFFVVVVVVVVVAAAALPSTAVVAVVAVVLLLVVVVLAMTMMIARCGGTRLYSIRETAACWCFVFFYLASDVHLLCAYS
jgi:hypothetical protein